MPAPLVKAADALKKITEDGYQYLDVRTEKEFAAGHAQHAVNIPVSIPGPTGALVPNQEFISLVRKTFMKDAKLVIGCKSGVRSARAAQMMMDAGYTNVVDQTEGWDGWTNAGLPTSTKPAR